MKRKEELSLIAWKDKKGHKPLIINGLRQVGKTWLLQDFGARHFSELAYLNLETNQAIHTVFTGGFDLDRILTALRIETGKRILPGQTLLVLDEIQSAPDALLSLKYFQEQIPDLHIACAGSLLGIALGSDSSFPVGKVEFLDLHPLNFPEFLEAIGEEKLKSLLDSHEWPLVNTFAHRYTQFLRQYYYTGGMPEVVAAFADDHDFHKARDIQKAILRSYELDFSKHAPAAVIPRIRMLWSSLPAQLAKENRKFIYNAIRPGARSKDYELALYWLIDAGLAHKVHNASSPQVPLKMYEDREFFKLFTADVGLLGAMVNTEADLLLYENKILEEFKGALTEQYVFQQLLSQRLSPIYYWSPSNARSEVDFILEYRSQIWPLEVKSEENLQAKSLKVFQDKYHPKICFRTSMSPYRHDPWITNIPLYAISYIYEEIKTHL